MIFVQSDLTVGPHSTALRIFSGQKGRPVGRAPEDPYVVALSNTITFSAANASIFEVGPDLLPAVPQWHGHAIDLQKCKVDFWILISSLSFAIPSVISKHCLSKFRKLPG